MPPPSASRKFMYPEQSVPYSVYTKQEQPDELFAKLDKSRKYQLKERPTCWFSKHIYSSDKLKI